MGTDIIPPKRTEPIVQKNGNATLRFNVFLGNITIILSEMPDVMAAIADVTTGSANPDIILLENKVNEILAGMRTAGVML